MKIIDTHMHFSGLSEYKTKAMETDQISSLNNALHTMAENNIIFGVGIGISDLKKHNAFSSPMLLDFDKNWNPDTEAYAKVIGCCPGIDPHMLIKYPQKYLRLLEQYLHLRYIVGIKIYLGYYLYHAYDPVYDPVYKLASLFDVPVIFHSGDLARTQGLLEYSQPLQIDRVASKYSDVKFVIAHFGNPWLMDAASVALKNPNVYIDLSGLVVGRFKSKEIIKMQKGYFDYLKCVLDYLFDYDKLLYASDWPFASMHEYLSLIKRIIPIEYYENVFYHNALKVFSRINEFI